MKWALWIIGVLAAIIAVVALIGMMVPRDHVATRTATFKAAPQAVWETLVDTKSYPGWRTDVTKVEQLAPANGKRTWRESNKNNSITYVVEEEAPPSRLVTRIVNQDLPFGGTWTYELAPSGSGTRLTITEKGWVSNPIFRFVSHFVLGETATMDSFLRGLGKHFGESVTPA